MNILFFIFLINDDSTSYGYDLNIIDAFYVFYIFYNFLKNCSKKLFLHISVTNSSFVVNYANLV